jgi:hypothetical protein
MDAVFEAPGGRTTHYQRIMRSLATLLHPAE